MKLIALSDIHGSHATAEALLRSEWPWDGLLMAGDLTTHGSAQETATAIDMFLSFGRPVAGVCGNMDAPATEQVFASKGISVHGTGVIWDGIGIAGVSGSPPTPMRTPYEIPEEEIDLHLRAGWGSITSARHTLLLSHAPPFGTALDRLNTGRHAGSTAVRAFIEAEQPSLVVCGHIHEARGMDTIGSTTVVNCGPVGMGCYVVLHVQASITIEMKG